MNLDPRTWLIFQHPVAPPPVTHDDIHAAYLAAPISASVTVSEPTTMSVKSILDKIGADAKAVFEFLGSSKGQQVIATGEGLVETFAPGTAGVFTLANSWLAEIVKSQALAQAASAQDGSSTQKAALVLSAVAPQALAFATANGLPAPTEKQLDAANTALVAFLNSFTISGATVPATINT